jgi:hypothetical protein
MSGRIWWRWWMKACENKVRGRMAGIICTMLYVAVLLTVQLRPTLAGQIGGSCAFTIIIPCA